MYLIDTGVTAWIPVRTRLWKEQIAASVTALDDFCRDIPALLHLVSPGLTDAEAGVATPPKALLKRLKSKSALIQARQTEFLRVTAKFTLDRDEFNEQNPSHELDEDIFLAVAAMQLGEALETLLMVSELSHPGRITTTEGIVTTERGDGGQVRPKATFFQLWFPDEEDPTWPPLTTVPLPQVVSWLNRTSFFKQALTKSRVERAFAAFTHMVQLGPYQEGEALFRAMQSLEAFYCDGTGDLRKQLADKSNLWLGPWTEKKNIVGHLYDMRSKFIHGSAKLQYWKDQGDPWEEDEKHMRSFTHSVVQATRLAIATLQKCIVEEVHDVEWTYAVRTSQAGA